MATEKQLYTVSVYTENNIGLLNRISAIFQRSHINIESLNISVSAAICCQNLSNKMRKSDINWKIEENEADEIMLNWLRNTIKSSEEIEQRFFENSKL